MQFDMIVMSPPCQPFCRAGKQQDIADERSKSFLSLLETLPKLKVPPSYILLENVKGFDTSQSRELLLKVLKELEYDFQEFLWSPLQFGIPNSRLRYYLIAKRKPLQFTFKTTTEIQTDIPDVAKQFLSHRKITSGGELDTTSAKYTSKTLSPSNNQTIAKTPSANSQVNCEASHSSEAIQNLTTSTNCVSTTSDTLHTNRNAELKTSLNIDSTVKTRKLTPKSGNGVEIQNEEPLYEKCRDICSNVGKYLEKQPVSYFEQFLIPEKFLRRFWVMDIVTANSRNCCCFTKRYAHHMDGSGSVVQMNEGFKDMRYIKQQKVYDDSVKEEVRSRQLRFFTPREIANLMCFPDNFCFPPEMSSIQCYRVLGNSLNVHVVAVLLKLLTDESSL